MISSGRPFAPMSSSSPGPASPSARCDSRARRASRISWSRRNSCCARSFRKRPRERSARRPCGSYGLEHLHMDLYRDLNELLSERLQFLPDKPEETCESTLKALWHAAAGAPKSAEQALLDPLP